MPKGVYFHSKSPVFIGKAKWLDSMGGRTKEDLLEDNKGKYVLMGNGRRGFMRVYLPVARVDKKVYNKEIIS